MKAYRIEEITWQATPDESKTLTISYRKESDADVPGSYTVVTSSQLVDTDGKFSSPVRIEFPLENTSYVVRFKVNEGGAEFTDTVVSPWSYSVLGLLDKVGQAMPNMQYTTTESGLRDSYLPEHIGLLHEFSSSFGDSLEQFGNAQYTVFDNNLGIAFDKRNNEIGIRIDSNVATLTLDPTDSTGNNELSLLGTDGKNSYSINIWVNLTTAELAQTGVDGKLWLWFCGTGDKHVGLYIDTTTKYVHWIHRLYGTIEEVVIDHAVIADAWIRICCRRDGNNPTDSYSNQILMVIDGSYYSPSTATYFSSATNYAGSIGNPIYIGMGKQASNGNIIQTYGLYKYFYYRQSVIDNNLREKVMNPVYPKMVIQDLDGSNEFVIGHEYFVKVTNVDAAFVFPHTVPTGTKKMFVRTFSNERTPVTIEILPFEKDTTGFDIDFTTGTLTDNRAQVVDRFYALHKSWGGYANGGVVAENTYIHNDRLVLECHGEGYDGTVQGVNRDSTPKVHTIENDPIWGSDPKLGQAWTERTGSCIVSKDYLGFGRYLIRCKIPQLLGVAPAWWTFHYEEVYQNTPDYELLLAEGLKREGNFADGYYLVRNHEIDIEQPSHLAMGVFNGWNEVETNVIFFDVNDNFHIGIQNDTTANNGLWKLNGSGLNPNVRTNWTKVSDTVNPVYQPSFENFKCNTWIGETGSGSGWRYRDSSIPDTQNDEVYLASLTPIGQAANDGNFHDYEWRWYKDRVEFYFDGVLKQTSTSFIPDIPSRLTIGNWFPSGTNGNGLYAPWLADPTKTWAGSPANWNFQKMIIERILFEPYDDTTAGGSNRLIGESYPFDGIKEYGL